jgi:hypothetical protein
MARGGIGSGIHFRCDAVQGLSRMRQALCPELAPKTVLT